MLRPGGPAGSAAAASDAPRLLDGVLGRRVPRHARRTGRDPFHGGRGTARSRPLRLVGIGGSIAHGLLARDYPKLEGGGFSREMVDELLVRPFVDAISTRSLTSELVRNLWRAFGSPTRTDLLADAFDRWFFDGLLLEQLPTGCRFIFNASSVTTGVRFGFERDVVGDWVMGRASTSGTGSECPKPWRRPPRCRGPSPRSR